MWGWVKKAVHAVGKAVKGALDVITHAVKIVIHRILGIPELIGTLIGIKLRKKIKVEAIVLRRNKKPVASLDDVRDAMALADTVFREQMNVRVVNRANVVVMLADDEVPADNLSVPCGGKLGLEVFSPVGDWFRSNSAFTGAGSLLGYGAPITVFVIEDVQGPYNGCSPGGFQDWSIMDPTAVRKSPTNPVDEEERQLTLAHETLHSCGLLHRSSHNLMRHASQGRTRHLTRWQQAVVRSSGHVTYR